jgi:hypothetical protein
VLVENEASALCWEITQGVDSLFFLKKSNTTSKAGTFENLHILPALALHDPFLPFPNTVIISFSKTFSLFF